MMSVFLPTGALSELIASADLIKNGYEVYRALSPSSFCDLLAIKNGEIFKLEIRTAVYYSNKDGIQRLLYPKNRTEGKSVVLVTLIDNKTHYVDFNV